MFTEENKLTVSADLYNIDSSLVNTLWEDSASMLEVQIHAH